MAYDPRQPLALGPQPQLQQDQKSNSLFGTTLVAGAAAGSGFIPLGKDKRLFDSYISAIRTAENVSPGGVLRTFKISEFLSPLESFKNVSVAPFEAKSGAYAAFLQNRFGKQAAQGLTLTKTGSIFGEVRSAAGDVVGVGMGMSGGTQKGSSIADYYTRVIGMDMPQHASLNEDLLKSKWRAAGTRIPYPEWRQNLDLAIREQRLLVGESIERNISLFGKNIKLSQQNAARLAKSKIASNVLRSKAAATAGRLNVLLSKPFELPVVGDYLSKLPGIRNLTVKQGTATQMFGGYLKKALIVGAAWKGLEYLDYQRSEGTAVGSAAITGAGAAVGGLAFKAPGIPFSKKGAMIGAGVGLFAAIAPRFEHGLFHGAAAIGTDANVMRAKASDVTGVTRSMKEQSEVTPGLLEAKTAIGFAGVGGLAASVAGYGGFLKKSIQESVKKRTVEGGRLFARVREEIAGSAGEKVWESRLGKKIASLPGGSKLSKVKSPFALGALAGLAAWQGLVSVTSLLQGEPLTAIPGVALLGSEESEEELQRVYSGEEEVAIKKGRWWEFGKCLMISTTCKLFSGEEKHPNEIKIGDVLVGRNYEPAKVINIFTRNFDGDGLVFSTAFDRDNKTYVTPNHIVPVFYRNTQEIREIPAEEIRLNDYVEIPYREVESIKEEIEDVVVFDNRLFAAIRSIEIEKYDDIVYDFEVDHPDHLFQAGTFLVHNSRWEGQRTEYYRPHMIHRLKTRAYQKGLWGDESEKWAHDPLLNPIQAIFGSDDWKYYYERKHQYDRPAPVTAPMGAEIPFVGPLVAATIGKLLKPQKLVRPEEWMTGEGPIQEPTTRPEEEVSAELGGLAPGSPVDSTTDISNISNKLNYLRREAVGLPGFVEGSIFKALIGREEAFPMQTELGTMGKETGSEYWLWKHLNLSGGALSTEVVRRFIPRTPSNWETYNPLRNSLPSWIPEDYFLDLKHGSPHSKIPEAELRLPGLGFVALHPELKGVHPEAYPLAYKVKILGDVAMWSPEYRSALRDAKAAFSEMTPKEIKMVKDTERQVREKKKRKEFSEYKALGKNLERKNVTVREVIDPRRVLTEEYGDAVVELQGFGAVKDMDAAKEFARDNLLGQEIAIDVPKDDADRFSLGASGARVKAVAYLNGIGGGEYGEAISSAGLAERKELDDEFAVARYGIGQRIAGALSEGVLHNIETPLDYLTPFAPASKFIHQRSAIEDYIATQAVGTESSFWDRPIENFLAPTANMARDMVTPWTSIPESVDRKRAIKQYFDMLEWQKANMLEKAAIKAGDSEAADLYKYQQQQTVFGADVYGDPTQVMRALPRSERDYYSAFVNAKTEEDREKILAMVPANERRVYTAAWQQKAANAARAKIQAGIATEKDKEIIGTYRKAKLSQGYDYDKSDLDKYYQQTGGEIPFDDYMREQIAKEYFSKSSLPDPSWVGFNSAVELDDVKMIYAESAGIDYHDLDLWDARKRALARKPYIKENLLSELSTASELSQSSSFAYHAGKLPSRYNNRQDTSTITVEENIGRSRFDVQISDQRTGLVESAYKEILGR